MGWHFQIADIFFWLTTKVVISYSQLDEELRQNLKGTMQQKYKQSGEDDVTQAVDKLQQEVWKLHFMFSNLNLDSDVNTIQC